jgi:N-acetyl-gamma-glutamylphosphate reductase
MLKCIYMAGAKGIISVHITKKNLGIVIIISIALKVLRTKRFVIGMYYKAYKYSKFIAIINFNLLA